MLEYPQWVRDMVAANSKRVRSLIRQRLRRRRAMAEKSFVRYDVVRKIENPKQNKPFWAKVGTITLFDPKPGENQSGRLQLFIFGEQEFNVFQQREWDNAASRSRSGEPQVPDPDDIPFDSTGR